MSLSDQWDNIQLFNRCVIGIPDGEERIGYKKYFKMTHYIQRMT